MSEQVVTVRLEWDSGDFSTATAGLKTLQKQLGKVGAGARAVGTEMRRLVDQAATAGTYARTAAQDHASVAKAMRDSTSVALESTKVYAGAKAAMEQYAGAADRTMGSAIGAREASRQFSGLGRSVTGLGGALGRLSLLKDVAAQFLEMASAAGAVRSRLVSVTQSTSELNVATDLSYRASQAARSDWQATAGVFAGLRGSTTQYGTSMETVARVTETVAKAVALSGGTAEAQSAALEDFGAALADGAVSGTELASVMKDGNVVAQMLAKGLGLTSSELQTMADTGQLTADRVVAAFQAQTGAVDQMHADMVPSVTSSWGVIERAAISAAGQIDQATGATSLLAQGADLVAGAIDSMADGWALDVMRAEAELWLQSLQDGVGGWQQLLAGAVEATGGDVGALMHAVRESVSFLGIYLVELWDTVTGALMDFPVNMRTVVAIVIGEAEKMYWGVYGQVQLLLNSWDTAVENIKHLWNVFTLSMKQVFAAAVDEVLRTLADGLRSMGAAVPDWGIFAGLGAQLSGAADALDKMATGSQSVQKEIEAENERHSQQLTRLGELQAAIEENVAAKRAAAQAGIDGAIAEREEVLANRDARIEQLQADREWEREAVRIFDEMDAFIGTTEAHTKATNASTAATASGTKALSGSAQAVATQGASLAAATGTLNDYGKAADSAARSASALTKEQEALLAKLLPADQAANDYFDSVEMLDEIEAKGAITAEQHADALAALHLQYNAVDPAVQQVAESIAKSGEVMGAQQARMQEWENLSHEVLEALNRAWDDMVQELNRSWTDMWDGVVDTGNDALDAILSKMLRLAAEDILISIGVGDIPGLGGLFGGGGSGGGLASVVNMLSGGGQLAGGVNVLGGLSTASSVLGYGLTYTGAVSAGAGASQAAMLAAQTGEFGLSGAALTSEALGGSLAAGIGGAIAALGAAAVFGLVLNGIFNRSKDPDALLGNLADSDGTFTGYSTTGRIRDGWTDADEWVSNPDGTSLEAPRFGELYNVETTPWESGWEDGEAVETPFGAVGFVDRGSNDFNASDEKVQKYLRSVAALDTGLASLLTDSEIEDVRSSLDNWRADWNSGQGVKLADMMRQRLGAIVDAVDPALGRLFESFEGTAEEAGQFAYDLLSVRNALQQDDAFGDVVGEIASGLDTDALRDTLGSVLSGVAGEFGEGIAGLIAGSIAGFIDFAQESGGPEAEIARVLGALEALAAPGENASQTLARVRAEFMLVRHALDLMGGQLEATGIAALEASSALVKQAGGLAAFQQLTATADQALFTNEQRQARQLTGATDAVVEFNAKQGLSGDAAVTNVDQLLEYMHGLDVTTEAGRDAYLAAQALAPAMRMVTDVTEAAFEQLGEQFGLTGSEATETAVALVNAAGGLDAFQQLAASANQALYTDKEREEQRLDAAKGDVAAFNADQGLVGDAMITNVEQLREYIDTLDVSTEAGRQARLAAMGVAESMRLVTDTQRELTQAYGEARIGVSSLLGGLRERIEMDLMNPEQKYDHLRDQAEQLAAGLQSLTSIGEVEAAVAEIERLTSQAWGLLSPEQQKAMGSGMVDWIDDVTQAANERLTTLEAEDPQLQSLNENANAAGEQFRETVIESARAFAATLAGEDLPEAQSSATGAEGSSPATAISALQEARALVDDGATETVSTEQALELEREERERAAVEPSATAAQSLMAVLAGAFSGPLAAAKAEELERSGQLGAASPQLVSALQEALLRFSEGALSALTGAAEAEAGEAQSWARADGSLDTERLLAEPALPLFDLDALVGSLNGLVASVGGEGENKQNADEQLAAALERLAERQDGVADRSGQAADRQLDAAEKLAAALRALPDSIRVNVCMEAPEVGA